MTSLDDNRPARDAVLSRVRKALAGSPPSAHDDAASYVAAHRHGPRPAMPADLVMRFMQRAADMASTVERVAAIDDVPAAVARYVDALELPARISAQRSRNGVCSFDLAPLAWRDAGLSIEARPTAGQDRLGITGCFCAIAETGTVVVTSGGDIPTATPLLTATFIVVVRAARIVSGMEEAFALVRSEQSTMPRAVHLISGPSRTGDIEQTIVLGAHGPFRMHVLIVG